MNLDLNLDMPLSQAKAFLADQKKAGEIVDCPCCGRRAKVYKRKLNGPLARALVLFYRRNKQYPGQYFHVNDYLKTFGVVMHDFSFLKFWKLIEAMPGIRSDGSTNTGFWRVTQLAVDFVESRYSVPEACYVDNNEIAVDWGKSGYGEKWIGIGEALAGGGFNFSELMSEPSSVERAAA